MGLYPTESSNLSLSASSTPILNLTPTLNFTCSFGLDIFGCRSKRRRRGGFRRDSAAQPKPRRNAEFIPLRARFAVADAEVSGSRFPAWDMRYRAWTASVFPERRTPAKSFITHIPDRQSA